MTSEDKSEFFQGFKDSFPVFVGYFAVAITLGITAANAGISPFQASLMSFMNVTSAGQAAGIQIISVRGSYFDILMSQVAINLRYLLQAAALTIKLKDGTSTKRRMLMSLGITDEIFGLSVKRPGDLNAMYTFGGYCMAMPGWVIGTLLGVLIGRVFPEEIIKALSIGIYVMFIAIIIPPARENRIQGVLIGVSAVLSYVLFRFVPEISLGIRVVIITVVLSCVAAWIHPIQEQD